MEADIIRQDTNCAMKEQQQEGASYLLRCHHIINNVEAVCESL